jgi:uncharacterized membrane protein
MEYLLLLIMIPSLLVQLAGYTGSRWLSDRRGTSGVLAGMVLPPALFLSVGLLVIGFAFSAANQSEGFSKALYGFVFGISILVTLIGVVVNVIVAAVVQWVRARNRQAQPGN